MGNELFGGLGGLMKGLSNLMPQDDPAVKMMNAHTQVGDLQKHSCLELPCQQPLLRHQIRHRDQRWL